MCLFRRSRHTQLCDTEKVLGIFFKNFTENMKGNIFLIFLEKVFMRPTSSSTCGRHFTLSGFANTFPLRAKIRLSTSENSSAAVQTKSLLILNFQLHSGIISFSETPFFVPKLFFPVLTPSHLPSFELYGTSPP